MPEQQKVDDIVESISITDKKKITKVEKSSTALEKEQEDIETTGVDEQEDIETTGVDEQEDVETTGVDDNK
jgi:hypothetical protein